MPQRWTNWSGEQVCAPERIERPGSEEAVADAVRRAVAEGRRVRVSASGHSFTDIACTDGMMLRLERMKRVLDVDRSNRLAKVTGTGTSSRKMVATAMPAASPVASRTGEPESPESTLPA